MTFTGIASTWTRFAYPVGPTFTGTDSVNLAFASSNAFNESTIQDGSWLMVDNISFVFGIFSQSGYINDIVGILTMEDDFKTIVNITILQQEETPGLGGKVVLREFLDQFIGLQFDDAAEFPIVVGPAGGNANAANEVDQISGATNTSSAFQNILTESYYLYKDLWESVGQ